MANGGLSADIGMGSVLSAGMVDAVRSVFEPMSPVFETMRAARQRPAMPEMADVTSQAATMHMS